MRKAIFLDRDGTLIEDGGYVCRVEDVKFYLEVIPALSLLKKDYLFFIITNQSGIEKGLITVEKFHEVNEYMLDRLKEYGINIEKTCFCPHTSSSNCDCRKPKTRYIEEIVSGFGISLKGSWVIGDHPSDVEMGKNAGCKTVYLLTGHGAKHLPEIESSGIKPTVISDDLLHAAKIIKKLDNDEKK